MAPPKPRRRALTANHHAVLSALKAEGRPLTAYDLIDALRDQGISSPPTVYRALTRLMEEGLVHRLESLNAFLACTKGAAHQGGAIFTICDHCGETQELTDGKAIAALMRCADEQGFAVERTTFELHGRCEACRSDQASA